jgi:O-antigen ligase
VGTAAAGIAALLLTPLGPLAWDFVSRSQSAEELESLSGRTDWWAYGYIVWKQHPYTGVGMYAAGKFAVMQEIGKGDTATMHSDWLEIFVGTSVWGLFPVIFLVLACWWLLARYLTKREFSIAERQMAMEAIGILMILTVRSFFNVELVWHSPSNFFPVVGYAEYMRRRWRNMQMERESAIAGFSSVAA